MVDFPLLQWPKIAMTLVCKACMFGVVLSRVHSVAGLTLYVGAAGEQSQPQAWKVFTLTTDPCIYFYTFCASTGLLVP